MDGAERAAVVGQALQLVFADWYPRASAAEARELISKEWAAERAKQMRLGVPVGVGSVWPAHGEDTHTTHLSTADSDGMMVALTQTLGPAMGSSVATDGLGFLYASTLGGYFGRLQPGERFRSNISPFMVLKDGEPVMVLGAAGGSMIEPAIVNTIVHFIDEGLSFAEAVAAPRVAQGSDGIEMETHVGAGWHPDVVEGVRALGLRVREVPRMGGFGRIHGIYYDAATGEWEGVADPDWEGTALGARRR
jgi:gamma-glutamyltranspeptidase/glutathione hydrolase